MPTDLASTETQEESISLLLLDQNLGSTDTQKESQSLLKKEKVDEESNRGKLSAKLCNGMFSLTLNKTTFKILPNLPNKLT